MESSVKDWRVKTKAQGTVVFLWNINYNYVDVYYDKIKPCKLGNKPGDYCKATKEDYNIDIVFMDVPMGAASTARRSQNWLSIPFQEKLRCTTKK